MLKKFLFYCEGVTQFLKIYQFLSFASSKINVPGVEKWAENHCHLQINSLENIDTIFTCRILSQSLSFVSTFFL